MVYDYKDKQIWVEQVHDSWYCVNGYFVVLRRASYATRTQILAKIVDEFCKREISCVKTLTEYSPLFVIDIHAPSVYFEDDSTVDVDFYSPCPPVACGLIVDKAIGCQTSFFEWRNDNIERIYLGNCFDIKWIKADKHDTKIIEHYYKYVDKDGSKAHLIYCTWSLVGILAMLFWNTYCINMADNFEGREPLFMFLQIVGLVLIYFFFIIFAEDLKNRLWVPILFAAKHNRLNICFTMAIDKSSSADEYYILTRYIYCGTEIDAWIQTDQKHYEQISPGDEISILSCGRQPDESKMFVHNKSWLADFAVPRNKK